LISVFVRLTQLVWLSIRYVLNACVITATSPDARVARQRLVRAAARMAPAYLAALDIRVRVIAPEAAPASPCLVVSNHLSDIDVLILNAFRPVVFVTSQEIRNSTFEGMLAWAGGSTYVERRHPAGLPGEIAAQKELLEKGFDVALFPEATTSNGDGVLPFRPSLFEAAIQAKATLVPLVLRYTNIGGEPVSAANRDRVFYYGAMTFFPHLWRLCQAGPIELELEALTPITLTGQEDRKTLSRQAHTAIARALRPAVTKTPVRVQGVNRGW